ncbi:hypothetical protein [Lacticaseibacillus kribbianus]|uniref:hypothetical protein n=1 Tax=Lacticaseibacillus kribbianus TaxID=2926292 RepID=UPI001CD4D2AD|nr:hypothetical protein [Lacticaseibacillus kribbianus]
MGITKRYPLVELRLDGVPVAPPALATMDWDDGEIMEDVAVLLEVHHDPQGVRSVLLVAGHWYRSARTPAALIDRARAGLAGCWLNVASYGRQAEAECGSAALPWTVTFGRNYLMCLTRSPLGALWLGMNRVQDVRCLGPAGFTCRVRLADGPHTLALAATPMSPATFAARARAAKRLHALCAAAFTEGTRAYTRRPLHRR